jgi:hypothetical protein
MRWLVWLYPRDWRRRYGAEMRAMLHQWRPGPREAFDLLRGALDAHLHPQWSPHARARRALAAGLGVLLAAFASHALAVSLGAARARAVHPGPVPSVVFFPQRQFATAMLLAGGWLIGAFVCRLIGARAAAVFSLLLALRFAVDWGLLPAAATRIAGGGVAIGVAASAGQVVLWGVVAVLVLRRSRLGGPMAFALGCLLELLLGGSGLSLSMALEQPLFTGPAWQPDRWDWSFAPGYLEPLRMAVWAAALAWIALRRRPRRPWNDPPAGAPVSARPAPDPPQPVSAIGRRAS